MMINNENNNNHSFLLAWSGVLQRENASTIRFCSSIPMLFAIQNLCLYSLTLMFNVYYCYDC